MSETILKAKDATLAIVTALPEEFAAAQVVFKSEKSFSDEVTELSIAIAELTIKGKCRVLILAMLNGPGNNIAGICAERLLAAYPQLIHIVMCGIAGAVPNPSVPENHVRLGDIVVSGQGGVVQYDFVKENIRGAVNPRHPPRPPSMELLNIVRRLESDALLNKRPWETMIATAIRRLGKDWRRPSTRFDRLEKWEKGPVQVVHPLRRRPRHPAIFQGTIASANKLLKNPRKRDYLRDNFGVRAVEMESSGIADATIMNQRQYFVIRGTCDYCDPNKGNMWHNYASVIAASFARSVVEAFPSRFAQGVSSIGNKHRAAKGFRDKNIMSRVMTSRPEDWHFKQSRDNHIYRKSDINITIYKPNNPPRLSAKWADRLQSSYAARIRCEVRYRGRMISHYYFIITNLSLPFIPLPKGHPSNIISKEEYQISRIVNSRWSQSDLDKCFEKAQLTVKRP